MFKISNFSISSLTGRVLFKLRVRLKLNKLQKSSLKSMLERYKKNLLLKWRHFSATYSKLVFFQKCQAELRDFKETASSFILLWSLICSLIMKDLTLNNAASFGKILLSFSLSIHFCVPK